jgi:hypothetical protein
MIDSGLGEPSTTKTIDLRARLEQIKAEDESKIQQIRADAFRSYEADLKALLSEERSTLASDFESFKSTLSTRREQITTEVKKDTRRTLWLMKVPLLFIVVVCAVTMVLEVSWFRIENRSRVHLAPWIQGGQKYMILDEPAWSLCTTETRELPVTQKNGTTKRATVVLQQPCRPVE